MGDRFAPERLFAFGRDRKGKSRPWPPAGKISPEKTKFISGSATTTEWANEGIRVQRMKDLSFTSYFFFSFSSRWIQ